MNGITIRPMRTEDYTQMIDLWKDTEGKGLSEADSHEGISQFLDRNPGLSCVAEERNEIVGTLLCGHDGRRGYLYHLAIRRKYRMQGIGKRIVAKCLDSLRESGILKCHLFIIEENQEGLRFWVHTGWTKRDDVLIASKQT